MKTKTIPSFLPTILKLFISVSLITWLVTSGHLDVDLIRSTISPELFFLVICFAGCNIFLMNYRWYLLLRNMDINKTIWETLQLALIGQFFNYMIPGAVGGDLIKGYYVTKEHPEKKVTAATSVLVDRIIGLYGMICLALFSIIYNYEWILENSTLTSIAATITLSFLGSSAVFALSLTKFYYKPMQYIKSRQNIFNRFKWAVKLIEALHSYTRSPRVLLLCLIMSLLAQSTFVLLFYYIAQAIGETTIPLGAFFFVIPIGLIVTALPLAPAGVGVGQIAFLYLFKIYTGESLQVGQTGITLIQVSLFIWGLVGAYFYLIKSKKQKIDLQSLEKVAEN